MVREFVAQELARDTNEELSVFKRAQQTQHSASSHTHTHTHSDDSFERGPTRALSEPRPSP
jgi:hypothetical protein